MDRERSGLGIGDVRVDLEDAFANAIEVEPGVSPFEPPTPPDGPWDIPVQEQIDPCRFWRGSEAELANYLRDSCFGPWTVGIAGELWQYDPQRNGWVHVEESRALTWVTKWDGAMVYNGRNQRGDVRQLPLRISHAKARGTFKLAVHAIHHDPELGDYWSAKQLGNHHRGIAQFSDEAVLVTQHGSGHLALEVEAPHPEHRVRASRVLPCPWKGVVQWEHVREACPVLWRVHLDWWGHHGEEEAGARLRAVLEFLGASVLGFAPTMARALFLYGPGGTGKSTLINLMTRWCRPGAVCSVTPQDMTDNRFAPARLDGAIMNVVDDLPADAIADAGVWKSSITGGRIDIERKGRDGYGIFPNAGHVYAGNRLPTAVKANSGFWRRWLVIEYDRVFSGTDADRPIIEELAGEMSAMMGAAIGAFLSTGGAGGRGYTEPGCHADIMAQWERVSDSVTAFAEDHLSVAGPNASKTTWPKRSDVYRAYRRWSMDMGRRPVSAHEFSTRIRDMGIEVSLSRGTWRMGCELLNGEDQ
jgi:P4 family phage/plasmid primase-like protien